MNDPKDIVVTISIGKDDNNSSESYIKEESKKSIILSEEERFNNLFFHLKENLAKRLYKKTIKEIDVLFESKYIEGYSQLWKISILKIRALLKIIKKKIIKYLINYYEKGKLKHHIFGIKRYFNQIPYEFHNFFENNKESKIINDTKILDKLLLSYFEYIYLISFFHKKIGNIIESISYLSLFIKLYKETQLIVKSNKTIYKIEKCFILLAHMMIYNEDYFSCIDYLDIAMNICLKYIIFHTPDLLDGVFIGDKKKLLPLKTMNNNSRLNKKIENEIENSFGDKKLKKVIINIVHIYFYRGICYENFGKIKNSIKSYIQCLWFLKHFFVNNFKSLSHLIKNILDKSLELKETIDFLDKKIKYYEHLQLKIKNINKTDNKDSKNNQYINIFYSKKFKELVNKLDKLKIYEIDTVNRFDLKKNIKGLNFVKRDGIDKNIFLSDLRLLNSYLREDFREIIDKMSKIKTYDMDYPTREKIQKLIRKIYFEQNQKKIGIKQKKINDKNLLATTLSFKRLNPYKNKSQNPNIDIKNNRYNSINNLRNSFQKVRTRSAFLLEKNRKIIPSYSWKSFSKKETININKSFTKEKVNSKKYFKKKQLLKKSKYSRLKSACTSQKIKIYEENKELNNFFNKKYIAKRNYIKKLEDRELHFQKSILRLKNTPKTPMPIYNKEIIKQNVNEIYQNKIVFLFSNPITNWRDNLSDEEVKKVMKYDKLENSVFKSLDNKAFAKYKEEENKQKIKQNNLDGFNWSVKNANNNNKDLIGKLTMGLEALRQKEIIENKNYKKLLKENKKHIKYRKEKKIKYNNSCGMIDRNNKNKKYSRNYFFIGQSYSSPQYY